MSSVSSDERANVVDGASDDGRIPSWSVSSFPRCSTCSASSSVAGEIDCGPRRFRRTGSASSKRTSASTPAFPRPTVVELQGLVQVLLAEKIFEGCGGLVLTDEIKVTIAAQACLLLLHRDTDIYPKLTTILVYPSAYVAKASQAGRQRSCSRGRKRQSR